MVEVDDDQFGKLKNRNPSDDQSLIGRPRNEDGDHKVSEGSKRKRQLMKIEILPLVLSNDSEVSGDDFEGGVHEGRVGRWGCGKRQPVWVGWGGAGKRKRRREIVFF
ncbi:PREDICTED: PRUPE_2G018900 [Prunus dulcis]|uniref:PREDICTED: PRUPE_2G018900 n=1 Tax=Prunus dulcis TaxID=3755 RepID=A0A5E4FXR0_PRUDU|nr:PREDICTED: PRUPE_2G018900 [Prunus dulcis]